MSDKSEIHPLRLKVEETQRFFEVIGEIIFQFSIVDYQLTGMLSIMMNYKSDEIGDFILNYLGATTGRKQQLLTKIVEVESVKLTIS
ncbi:MAG: hypothetical protein GXO86_11935, partial [Chlorobi bacterium]|nr:hypothetical protein [Chlorobiota bacterium]